MTTTVKVSAHCADNVRVNVFLNGARHAMLVNGETKNFYVYGESVLSVHEVLVSSPDLHDMSD